MLKTEKEIIKIINQAKPDYLNVVNRLQEEDYPILYKLTQDNNIELAFKAISCLGLLKTEKSLEGVELAVKSQNPELRSIAAHALRYLTDFPKAVKLIDNLLDDPNLGVRKFALKTIAYSKVVSLKEKVGQIILKENNRLMKNLSQRVMESLDKFENNNLNL